MFRQGGTIREFENVGRLQGESVHAFVRRFRLLERKLQDNKVPEYPEPARVIKLLDGLRLDEKSVSSLLLAAGNRYNMKAILDAISIQYPAGMSVTGLPRLRLDSRRGRGRGSTSSARSLSASSSRPPSSASSGKRWRQWATSLENDNHDDVADEYLQPEELLPGIPEDDFRADEGEETMINEDETNYFEDDLDAENYEEYENPEDQDYEDLLAAAQALTVTSKKLAQMVQARGYYQTDAKGKKGKGKGKAKGKGRSSKGLSSKTGGKTNQTRSSKGASGKGKTDPVLQQQRLKGSLCLGCGAADHWLKDCPVYNVQNAQLASANVDGLVLDAEGAATTWTLTATASDHSMPGKGTETDSSCYEMPPLESPEDEIGLPREPCVLLQYCQGYSAAYVIADTGCQRQVAGSVWHSQKASEIQPLQRLSYPDNCKFSFGPNAALNSQGRYVYPAAMAGVHLAVCISSVDAKAPALMSRKAFEVLGGVPDVHAGTVHFRALGCTTTLWLSPCGHLAVRLDEWGSEPFEWPPAHIPESLPDVIHSSCFLSPSALKAIDLPARPVPHATANMVDPVAESSEEAPQLRVLCEADDSPVLGHYDPAEFEGYDPARLWGAINGYNSVVNHCGDGGAGVTTGDQVPAKSGEVESSFRSEGLRSIRSENPHLRPLRHQVRGPPVRHSSTGNAKSLAFGKDSAESPRTCDAGHSRKERSSSRHRRGNRTGHVPRLLSTLLNILAGICASTTTSTSTTSTSANFETEDGSSGQEFAPAFEPEHTATEAMAWIGQRPYEYGDGRVQRRRGLDEHGSGGGRDGLGSMAGARRGSLRLGSFGRLRGQPLRSEQFCPGRRGGRPRGGALNALRDPPENASAGPRHMQGSPDYPLLMEDRGAFRPKVGLLKRVRGNEKAMHALWQAEARMYLARTAQARKHRSYKTDLIEIFGGHAEITRVALQQGLRAVQPVDQVYGVKLGTSADWNQLRSLLAQHRPFLIVYEIECTLWSNIQNLNYDQVTLEALRHTQDLSIREMVRTICECHETFGGHFLLENPANTNFWKHPQILRLLRLPDAELRVGHMCRYNLRGKTGLLLKKPTGWMSDLPVLLDQLCRQCPGSSVHEHGEVLGGSSKLAQVYTRELATAAVKGLVWALRESGDERFVRCHEDIESIWKVESPGMGKGTEDSWQPAGEQPTASVFFLDVSRHEDSWLPLLKETEEQLRGKVRPDKVMPLNTPFGEQLRALVPWKVLRIQLCRTPMQRRLPVEVIQAGAKHRGAALWLSDGSVSIEAEAVSQVLAQSATRFASPVRAAIFFFGIVPDSSLNEKDNAQPEAGTRMKPQPQQETDEATEMLKPHQPGFRDISFPGLHGTPKWLLQVLRRLHTNLGHPSTPTMVRHLTASGASDAAVQAARHLRCKVCLRVQPPREPRPAKPFTPRPFNDRLDLDVLWLHDIRGTVHGYLSQVDDATCYHVLSYLPDRSEEEVIRILINGWFSYFGPPDEMLLDADGSFRGYRFETLQAQCAVKVRYAPADAHYQMGRVERHGQAVRYIVRRLVSQFAPVGHEELNIIVMMAAAAKNSLMRRAGSSPCQWVYGRNPKLPGSLLSSGGNIESCNIHSDSDRLREVEQIRTHAMMLFHQFETDNALRNALLRKPRPARGPFVEGQRVAYYRLRNSADGEGTLEGYRQGVIVAVDNSTLWIRNNRGRLISASKEQVRSIGGEEEWWVPSQADLDLLKKSDQDLAAKHGDLDLAFRSAPDAVPQLLLIVFPCSPWPSLIKASGCVPLFPFLVPLAPLRSKLPVAFPCSCSLFPWPVFDRSFRFVPLFLSPCSPGLSLIKASGCVPLSLSPCSLGPSLIKVLG